MPPPPEKSPFRLFALVLNLSLQQLFLKLQRPPFIMLIHTTIYIYMYVCAMCFAHIFFAQIQAHLLGWHSAHREVSRSIPLKHNCQAMMGFGGQPRALLSPGRQASQHNSSSVAYHMTTLHWHTYQSKEDFKGERKEESWLVLQAAIKTHFVAVINSGQCCCG